MLGSRFYARDRKCTMIDVFVGDKFLYLMAINVDATKIM